MPSLPGFVHRGDISAGPENTLSAELAALNDSAGMEADIMVTKDGEHFLFHDADMKRLTGVKKQVAEVTWAEVENMSYVEEVNGLNKSGKVVPLKYNRSQRGIMSLRHFLNASCKENPNAQILFDTKEQETEDNVKELVKIVVESPCKPGQAPYVFASAYPWESPMFGKELDAHEKTRESKVSFYLHPGTLPLGLEVWLRTRLFSWYGPHDVLSLHHKVYEQHYDLIKGYKDDGWCLAIYGGPKSVLNKWADKVDYMTFDTPSNLAWGDWASVDVQYQPNPTPYYVLWLLCLLSLLLLIVSLWKTCAVDKSSGDGLLAAE